MLNIAFTPKGWSDLIEWSKTDRKIFQKVSILIEEASKNPFNGTGKPEPLLSGKQTRIKKVSEYVGNEPFMLTYGDGVGDIDIAELLKYHQSHGKAITMTSVQPEGRYGSLVVNEKKQVTSFLEKPKGDGAWINAGFFVCQPEVFDYIPDGDKVIFEREPLESLARDNQLFTYKHEGFWKPMDTQRDKFSLEDLIEKNKAPWISW